MEVGKEAWRMGKGEAVEGGYFIIIMGGRWLQGSLDNGWEVAEGGLEMDVEVH